MHPLNPEHNGDGHTTASNPLQSSVNAEQPYPQIAPGYSGDPSQQTHAMYRAPSNIAAGMSVGVLAFTVMGYALLNAIFNVFAVQIISGYDEQWSWRRIIYVTTALLLLVSTALAIAGAQKRHQKGRALAWATLGGSVYFLIGTVANIVMVFNALR